MDQGASLFVLGSFVVACCAKVARLPRPGESLHASAFKVEAGGKGFNLAIGAQRLGAQVGGIFAIGTDSFSQMAVSTFTQAGLSPGMLRRFETTTGSGIGFTDARGENCLAVYPGANWLLSAHEIRSVAQTVQASELVLAQFEIGDEPIVEAFALARAAGRMTLLNPSPYRPVDPRILQDTSVLVLNRVEAAEMARGLGLMIEGGQLDCLATLASTLFERGPELIVVTLGADGAIACRRDALLRQPAFPIEAVDTLGAGDAFTAGFAASLLQGFPLRECLRRAAACGAIVCQGAGVLECLPTAHDLEEYLCAVT